MFHLVMQNYISSWGTGNSTLDFLMGFTMGMRGYGPMCGPCCPPPPPPMPMPYIPFSCGCSMPFMPFYQVPNNYPSINYASTTPVFNYSNYYKPQIYSLPTLPTFGSATTSTITSPQVKEKENVKETNNSLSSLGNSKIMKNIPAARKKEILSNVEAACKQYNVDPKLVISMMYRESGFDPKATSRYGAGGLMQLMPATGKSYGANDIYDIKQNIFAAVKFIKYLKDRYNGNMDLMVAAYNAGPGRVKNSVPNIKETKNYVAKVKQTYNSLG